MRYFIFSATHTEPFCQLCSIYGTAEREFPSITRLKEHVKKEHPKADSVMVMSISEVSEEDYKRFWDEA